MNSPRGFHRLPTGTRFTELARRWAREKQERTCVQSEDFTRGDRPRKIRALTTNPLRRLRFEPPQLCKHTR